MSLFIIRFLQNLATKASIKSTTEEIKARRSDLRCSVELAGKERVVSEILLPVMYNPNTKANIREVLLSHAVDARLEGVGCPESPSRRWIEICSDLGAKDFDLLDGEDGNRFNAEFGNVRFRFPIGHEGMALMTVVLKLMLEHGYSVFGPCFGFKSARQIEILFNGFDNHKCNEFILHLCRPAITDKFISEYIRLCPVGTEATLAGLIVWLTEVDIIDNNEGVDNTDIHFCSHKYLAIDLFTAYACFVRGTREGKHSLYTVGRKMLLPFLGVLGHYVYFKGIIRDIYEYEYRCKPEVRRLYKSTLTMGDKADNKQGYDFKMEEVVANMKQIGIGGNSKEAYDFAAVLADKSRGTRSAVFNQAGKRVPRDYNIPRSKNSLDLSLEACRLVCDILPSFRNGSSFCCKTIDGKGVLKYNVESSSQQQRTDVLALLLRGKLNLEEYVNFGFKVNPTVIKLSAQLTEYLQEDAFENSLI